MSERWSDDVESELRDAIRGRAGRIAAGEGLDGVRERINRRRARRRMRLVAAGVVILVFGILGAVAAMSGSPELETVAPESTVSDSTVPESTPTTAVTTTTTLTTTTVPWQIPPCTEVVVPQDRTPTPENPRPFPTYVPQYNFEGLRFDEVACRAELNGVQIRVWKWDGVELVAEALGRGGIVNLVIVDYVVTEATFAPSATATSQPAEVPPTTHPPSQSTFNTTIPAPETTLDSTSSLPPLPGPTFVPEYNFVGLTLVEAEAVADERSLVLRVWKIDGEEVLPEAFGQGAVNIELVDGIVAVAVWSPSP